MANKYELIEETKHLQGETEKRYFIEKNGVYVVGTITPLKDLAISIFDKIEYYEETKRAILGTKIIH